jgi:hypothetical protein
VARPSKRNDDDQQWPCAPDPNDRQPPAGKYLAAYVGSNLVARFDRRVLEQVMEIVEPANWAKIRLTRYYGIPKHAPPSIHSEYYKAWVLANGKPPRRNDRMSPSVFQGWWQIEVRHTKRRSTRNGCRELETHESGVAVVDRLIERVAGGARG